MKPLYILAALMLAACTKQAIDWDAVDCGVIRAADSYREETHK